MKAYLAASWPMRSYAERCAKLLEERGVEIVSTWHRRDESGETPAGSGQRDIDDLYLADALIEVIGDTRSTGGRFVEFGCAIGLNLKLYTVGERDPKESIFLELAENFEDFQTFIEHILDGEVVA